MPIKQPIGKKPAPATARTLPKPGPSPVEPEDDETGGGEAVSKEDAFDNAEPESGFSIPAGSYVANLVGAQLDRSTPPKEAVVFSYEIKEGEQEGKTVKAWYNFYDKNGQQQRGIGFFKRDMEMLGQPAFKYAKLEDALQQLEAERLEVNINVKQNGQYTNIFLQGLSQG